MTQSNILESTATGQEIEAVVNTIQPVLAGTPVPHAIIAMLSIILMLSKPAITPDELQMGVADVSRYICFMLDNLEDMPSKLMN